MHEMVYPANDKQEQVGVPFDEDDEKAKMTITKWFTFSSSKITVSQKLRAS